MVKKFKNVEQVVVSHLCHGCGACANTCETGAITLIDIIDVGIRPIVSHEKCTDCNNCIHVCSGIELSHDPGSWPSEIISELSPEWGPVLEVWEGHAVDQEIRHVSSSGGVTTALAQYCFEKGGMEGVLQVSADSSIPYLNKVKISRSRNEIISCAGSRYSPAPICSQLRDIERYSGTFVLIGKPCDIASSLMTEKVRPSYSGKIGLTISIFCGGTPSTKASLEIIRLLGAKPDEVADMRYRGYGWPGKTGIRLKGEESSNRLEMTYQDAWNGTLTNFKPFRCQICPDPSGEFADISCGDPWYRPILPGEEGSTLIIIRSKRGRRILQDAMQDGYIKAIRRSPETLPQSQKGVLQRRRRVLPKIIALKLLGLPCPEFDGFSLFRSFSRIRLKGKIGSLWRAFKLVKSLKHAHPSDKGAAFSLKD